MFNAWKKNHTGEEQDEVQFKAPIPEEVKTPEAPVEEIPTKQQSSIEGNLELKVVRPESMDEIFTIADYLLDGCTVVLNLELLDGAIIKRMLDFLNGVTYSTGGTVKNVSKGTYIITPTGININRQ